MRREEPIPALSTGLSYVMMTGLLLSFALPAGPPAVPLAPSAASPPAALPVPATHVEPSRPVAAPARPVPPAPASPAAPAAEVAAREMPRAPAAETASAPAEATRSQSAPVAAPLLEEWPQDEVARAREQCQHVLSSTPAEIEWMEPVRKGSCGLPAPIRLKSVGASPKIVFEPAVQVNCRMAVALAAWAKSSLQPEAKAHFGSEVVRIVGASGYSCRNIYNRPNARLSQHALANAIDIGGFALADGRVVGVLKGWGLTARDITAQAKVAAAAAARAKDASKAKDDKAKEDRAKGAKVKEDEKREADAAKGAGKTKGARGAAAGTTAVTKASLSASRDAKGSRAAAVSEATETKTKAGKVAPAQPAKATKEALFLRAIHKGACGPFGTVLGPEANDPHRNHFHLDLIPRRSRGYCQ